MLYLFHHKLYAYILLRLDNLNVAPVDFTILSDELLHRFDREICEDREAADEFIQAVTDLKAEAQRVNAVVEGRNVLSNMDDGAEETGKFERKTFKLLIGGSTASNACSMQGYKSETGLRKYNYGKGYDKRQNTATDDSICDSSYIGKFISDFI